MPPKRKAQGKVKTAKNENIPAVPETSGSGKKKRVKVVEDSALGSTITTRRSARVAAGKDVTTAPAPTAPEAVSAVRDDQHTAEPSTIPQKRGAKAANTKAKALAVAPPASLNAAASLLEGSTEAAKKESAPPPTVAPHSVNALVAVNPAIPPTAPASAPPPGKTSMPPPPGTIPPPGPISSQPQPGNSTAPQPKKRIRNSIKMLINNNILPPLPPPECLEYMRCGIQILDDDDDDDDKESEDPNEKTPPPGSPESKWFISKLGANHVGDMCDGCMKRCPDAFGMYVFNDFWAYGIIEVMENWALDWARMWDRYKSWKGGKLSRLAMAKARKIDKLKEKSEVTGGDGEGLEQEKPKWEEKEGWEAVKELWALTEGFVVWLGKGFNQHYMVDDGERVLALYELLTAMLSGTFHLLNDIHETHKSEENPRPLAPIKNLGLMCACAVNHYSNINPNDEDTEFCPMVYRYTKRWGELEDAYVKEMVEKGVDVGEIDEEEQPEDKLSSIDVCVRAEKMLAEYKASYSSSPPSFFYRPPRIGGNSYDITKMSESEKKEYSYGSSSEW